MAPIPEDEITSLEKRVEAVVLNEAESGSPAMAHKNILLPSTTGLQQAIERVRQLAARLKSSEDQLRKESGSDEHGAFHRPSIPDSERGHFDDSHGISRQIQRLQLDDHPQQVVSPDFHSNSQHHNQGIHRLQLDDHPQQVSSPDFHSAPQHQNQGSPQHYSQRYSPYNNEGYPLDSPPEYGQGYLQCCSEGYPQDSAAQYFKRYPEYCSNQGYPQYYNGGYQQYFNRRYQQYYNPGYQQYYNPGYQQCYNQGYETRKIDVPNSKLHLVLATDTLMYLQDQSGARIEPARDFDSRAPTRPVLLMGTPDQVSRADQLIKEEVWEQLIKEELWEQAVASVGGSRGLEASSFEGLGQAPSFERLGQASSFEGLGQAPSFEGLGQAGDEEQRAQIKVPNHKIGSLIGRGGETITNLQRRSGARIQLVPPRDRTDREFEIEVQPGATERMVYLLGNKNQIDCAKELIARGMEHGFSNI